jgi:hypothetical protein
MKSKLKRVAKSSAHKAEDLVTLATTEIADAVIVAGERVLVDAVKEVAVNAATIATTQVIATTIVGSTAAVTPVGAGIGVGLVSYGIYKALKN